MEVIDLEKVVFFFEAFLILISVLAGYAFLHFGAKKNEQLMLIGIGLLTYKASTLLVSLGFFDFFKGGQHELHLANFTYLTFPLFFLQLKRRVVVRRYDFLIVLTGVCGYFVQTYFVWTPFSIRLFNNVFFVGGNLLVLILLIGGLCFCFFRYHKENKGGYSRSGVDQMKLVRRIIFLMISYIVLCFAVEFFEGGNEVAFFVLVFDLFFVFSVIHYGYYCKGKLGFLRKNDEYSSESLREMEFIALRVESYMGDTEAFLEKNYSVSDLSNALGVTAHKLSAVLNRVMNRNFNSYVNMLRVERAKSYIRSEEFFNFTVDAIGAEVGFRSKSVFYAAFKKEVGVTPLQYRRSMVVSNNEEVM